MAFPYRDGITAPAFRNLWSGLVSDAQSSGSLTFIDLLAGGRLPGGGVTWWAVCRHAAMNQKIKRFARSGSRIRLNSEGAWIVAGEVSGER